MIRVIGIDPGRETGFAQVCDGKFEALASMTFWRCYDYVTGWQPSMVTLIVVEVSPRKQTHLWHSHKKTTGAGGKVGQDVGGVRVQGELLAERFAELGFNVKTVLPAGKVGHERFKAVTGCAESKTNSHKRDAGMMAFREYCRLEQMARIQA